MSNLNMRDLQAIERKKQIQLSAKDLFASNGYHNTSIREIADRSNIASGLIYHYFPEGKQQILDSIVEQGSHEMLKHLQTSMEYVNTQDLSLREGLKFIADKIENMFMQDSDLTRIIFFETKSSGIGSIKELKDLFPENKDLLSNFLRKKAESGEIKELNYDLAGAVLMGMMLVTVLQHYLDFTIFKKDYDVDSIINFLVDLFSK